MAHEARDQHRRQADYERRLRSNVLTAEERQNIKPSPISSILLESSSMPTSFSHNADGDVSSQDSGASVSVPRRTPPQSPEPHNPGRMEVDDWVQYTQQHPPSPPTNGHESLGADPSGRRRARSPPIGHGYPGTHGNRIPADRPPRWQYGFPRDPPPHLPGGRHGGAAGGAGGGSNEPGSSSSCST